MPGYKPKFIYAGWDSNKTYWMFIINDTSYPNIAFVYYKKVMFMIRVAISPKHTYKIKLEVN